VLGGQRGRQGGCLVARQRLSHDDDVAVMRDHDLGEGAGRDAHDTGAAQLCRCVASDLDDVAGELEGRDVQPPGYGRGPRRGRGMGTARSVRVNGVFTPLT
jgi:hypothetical protein